MWSNTLPAVFILVLCVAWMPVESSFFSHLVHHVEEEVHKAGHKLEDHVKDQIKDNLNHLEDKVEEKGGDLSQKLMDHVEQSLEKEGGSALAGLTGSLLNAFAGNQDANSNTVDDDTGDSTRALQGKTTSDLYHYEVFISIGITIVMIRCSWDHLIQFMMRILIWIR